MGIKRGEVVAIWAAAVGAVAVGGAAFVRRLNHGRIRYAAVLNETLPVNSKWWREHAAVSGEILYVAMGDSAAQGIGATAPDRSYVGVIAGRIAQLTGRTVRTVNLSVSGARVKDAVAVQLPAFRELAPDIVTVAIGANDVAEFEPAGFERDVRELFAALPPHAIVADLPYFYLPRNERTVAYANAVVRRLAREFGLTVAPLYRTTRHAGMRGALTLFAKDMFHPNDRGYRLWADAFTPALDEALPLAMRSVDSRQEREHEPEQQGQPITGR
ncbi:MAG TPA: SGNH/GDSL hydrolase family protein [Humibacter sp.]|nr:SGNH/GDSL hydrolase family protein [Humibacter sp.]